MMLDTNLISNSLCSLNPLKSGHKYYPAETSAEKLTEKPEGLNPLKSGHKYYVSKSECDLWLIAMSQSP